MRQLTLEQLETLAVHPDGFLKLSIGPKDWLTKGQIRLHFWIPGRAATRQPHSHPWHLASLALAGTYSEYRPKLIQADRGELKKFMVSYAPDKDLRVGVHQVGVESFRNQEGPQYITGEGHAHYLPAGPVHMSSPRITGGITLAIMSPRFSNEAYFYSSEGINNEESITRDDIVGIMRLIKSTYRNL